MKYTPTDLILLTCYSTPEMKLMAIVIKLSDGEISKIQAYELFEKHGLFSKKWMKIDQDCVDLLSSR